VIDVSVGKNPEAKLVLANPEIIHVEGDQREEEGVFHTRISRLGAAPGVRDVRAQNVKGERMRCAAEGLLARAFCHEIDHLNGILFIQHLSMLKGDLIKRRIRKLRKTGEW